MKAYARPIILLLALVALASSIAALYVHFRLIEDPTYSSFCDVNETVSCQAVYQSRYGTVFGIPVAAGGAIWAALVFILAFAGMRHRSSELAGRVAGYIFLLATIGLAAVFYFAWASFFVLGQACPLCIAVYVTVAGIFLVSATAASAVTSIPAHLGEDLRAVTRSHSATTLAVGWLAATIALVVLFPREQSASAEPLITQEQAAAEPALETLSPEQQAEWDKYLDSQTPVADLLPNGNVKVRVVKFNDYQCPACRQTYMLYRGIIAKYEAEHPEVFVYETHDFPLESECGAGGSHSMACEAAAAVRMARAKNRDRELEAWLFNNQSFEMTRDDVKKALQQVAQVSDFDTQYPTVIDAVRADSQLGQRLGVNSTPTFYVNGIKLSSLRPAYFDATIRYALKKAGVTS